MVLKPDKNKISQQKIYDRTEIFLKTAKRCRR